MEIKKILGKYQSFPTAAKASFWFLFCNVVQKAMAFVTVPIITRMLTTVEYGTYSVFVSYCNILIVFATLSLSANGYYVGMKRYGEDKKRYTSSIAGLTFVLTTVTFATALCAQSKISAITGLSSLTIVLMFLWVYGQGAINLWFAESRYEFRYRLIVKCTIFIAAATLIFKIVFVILLEKAGADKSLGAVLGYVVPVILIGTVAWFIMFKEGKTPYVKQYWKFALIFNIPLLPYYISQNLLNQVDRILIEQLDSVSSAGIYSVAYSLAGAIGIINAAVNSSFIPWQFQAMGRGEQGRVAKVINLIIYLIMGIHLILIFVAPEIMRLFAAPEYFEAIYVVPPVTIGILVIWMTQLFINIEFFYEKNKLISISSVISASVNIALNIIAIPMFGYLAAGYTTLICYLINMVFHGIVAVKLTKKMGDERAFDLRKIVICTLISIVGMFLIMAVYELILIRYGLLIFFCVLVMLKRKQLIETAGYVWKSIKEK